MKTPLTPTELRERYGALLDRHPAAPALLVTVASKELLWSSAFGVLDLAAALPAPPDACFRIASVTKTFVAASVMVLAELGDLALEDLVSSRLSQESIAQLSGAGYHPELITVEHLLAHTSGLPDHASLEHYQRAVLSDPHHHWTRAEQLALAVSSAPPIGAPGDAFSYSDTGYILLGEILERVTGRALGSALRSLLHFDELGLHSTAFELEEPAPHEPLIAQYIGELDIRNVHASVDLFGGGGLISTTTDLTIFISALFEGRIVSEASLQRMLTASGAHGGTGWGLGLFRLPEAQGSWWGHTGFWGVSMAYNPENQTAVALACTQQPAAGGINVTSAMEWALA